MNLKLFKNSLYINNSKFILSASVVDKNVVTKSIRYQRNMKVCLILNSVGLLNFTNRDYHSVQYLCKLRYVTCKNKLCRDQKVRKPRINVVNTKTCPIMMPGQLSEHQQTSNLSMTHLRA